MMRTLLAAVLLTTACATTTPAPDEHAHHSDSAAPSSRLESTPRHDEWIEVQREGRNVRAYVVHPQRSSLAPVIVVIHENRGLTDWVRTVADRLAEHGYLAIAPDFLSGTAPNGGGTKDYPTEDAAREGISKLPRAQVMDDLRAVIAHARTIPSASADVSVAGFCWGGSRSWDAANSIDGLKNVYVFYGGGPQDAAGVAGIEANVYGFYGGDDARVNATIPKSEELMRAAGKTFEPVIYEGAGHAFMRLGELPDATPANRKAHDEAWARWKSLLR